MTTIDSLINEEKRKRGRPPKLDSSGNRIEHKYTPTGRPRGRPTGSKKIFVDLPPKEELKKGNHKKIFVDLPPKKDLNKKDLSSEIEHIIETKNTEDIFDNGVRVEQKEDSFVVYAGATVKCYGDSHVEKNVYHIKGKNIIADPENDSYLKSQPNKIEPYGYKDYDRVLNSILKGLSEFSKCNDNCLINFNLNFWCE
jgi:hypothetical protein